MLEDEFLNFPPGHPLRERVSLNPIIKRWKNLSQVSIDTIRDDLLPMGFGSKFRRFQGFLSLPKFKTIVLRGNLHGNFLGSFTYLFGTNGYNVVSLGECRMSSQNVFQSGNSILVKKFSNQFFLGTRTDLDSIQEKLFKDQFKEKFNFKDKFVDQFKENDQEQERKIFLPAYGFAYPSTLGYRSLWEKINWKEYSHFIVDIGSGLSYLSYLDFLEKRRTEFQEKDIGKEYGIPIGICLGESKKNWLAKITANLSKLNISIPQESILLNNLEDLIWEPKISKGFSKINQTLIQYIQSVYKKDNLPLDPFYSGKSLYTVEERIDSFPKGSKILYFHQGGLLNWTDLYL